MLRKVTSESQSRFDIFGLRILISSGPNNDQLTLSFFGIHPVTRSIVDSQLRHTFTDWLNIASISRGQSFDPGLDVGSGLNVAQTIKPLSKVVSFANCNH